MNLLAASYEGVTLLSRETAGAWSARRDSAMMSTSGSASIHSWHMPGPNGPSRITVGGTTSKPAARDTA